jgi:hypothetical protein
VSLATKGQINAYVLHDHAGVAASAPSCWVIAQGQNAPAPSGAAAPGPAAPAPVVSTQADDLLKQMADYIGSAEQFTFHADITFDHVLPTGQKLQFSATEDVALQRPGSLYVEWSGDLGDRQFWYDGSQSRSTIPPHPSMPARQLRPRSTACWRG